MDYETAIAILHLEPGCSKSEVKDAFEKLYSAAISAEKHGLAMRLREAFAIAKLGEENAPGAAQKRITGSSDGELRPEGLVPPLDGVERKSATSRRESGFIPRNLPAHELSSQGIHNPNLPPYEEPLIVDRILRMPDRIEAKCQKTGRFYSCALNFNYIKNKVVILNSSAAHEISMPTIQDVVFPVTTDDCKTYTIIEAQNYDDRIEKRDNFYRSGGFSEIEQTYSRPTGIDTIDNHMTTGFLDFSFSSVFKKERASKDLYFDIPDDQVSASTACPHCDAKRSERCGVCGHITCLNNRFEVHICAYCGHSVAESLAQLEAQKRTQPPPSTQAPSKPRPSKPEIDFITVRKAHRLIEHDKPKRLPPPRRDRDGE